jgi:hypothetical protein
MSSEANWQRYQRRGEVTAEKRDQGWTWRTTTGEVMEARPGDWAVTDASGSERSVAAGVFESTHEQVAPGRYRRSGTVLARRVTEREIVSTLEGEGVANAGDWVVQGAQGEQWPVPDAQFRASYEPFPQRKAGITPRAQQ